MAIVITDTETGISATLNATPANIASALLLAGMTCADAGAIRAATHYAVLARTVLEAHELLVRMPKR